MGNIKLHWKMVDERLGFMERIELPEGGEILFNQEEGRIDFTPLEPYIGRECDYFVDGEYRWTKKLDKIGPNEDGVKALFFTVEPDEPINYDLHPSVEMNKEE